jgi:ankyrin repeat protein
LKYLIGRQIPFGWCPTGNVFAAGSSPLHLAAWTQQPKLVEKLILSGAETNARDSLGWTPLHFAVSVGCKDSVSFLLGHGANPTVRDNDLQTPLMVACGNRSIPVIDLLIVHEQSNLAVDIQGWSALHHSVSSNDFEAFIYLLEARYDPYHKSAAGQSSINDALSLPRFSTYVLNAGLDLEHLIPTGDKIGYPQVFLGNARLLRLFLRRFPEVSRRRMVNYKYAMQEHPLSRAACYTDIISMEAMIRAGVDIEVFDPTGRTPLINACLAGCLASVKLLIRKGAKLQYDFNGQSMNALEAAQGQEKVIKWLLVLRHTEHRRITNIAETEEQILKYWSGIREMEVPIEGYYSRNFDESRLDWVKYIHARKADWRSMVPLDWSRASHIAPLFIRPAHSLDGERV